jgi:hypothetical protein
MKAKQTIGILALVILIVVVFGTLKNRKEKLAIDGINEWFNGWTSGLVKIRTIYHEQVGLLPIPDMNEEDYLKADKLGELKNLLQKTKKLELWKIDTATLISDYWYNKIDQMQGKLTADQIGFLKSYFLDGQKRGADFRQLTVTYFDDYLTVVNFMYSTIISGKNLDKSGLQNYNELQATYIRSQENYTKKVKDIFAYNLKRVEEFNSKFNNPNVTKMINLIKPN